MTATGPTTSVTNVMSSPYRFYQVILAPQPITETLSVANGIATITWNSVTGQTYTVQYKDSLADPIWHDLLPTVTAAGPAASKTDPISNRALRIFRVMTAQ